MLARLGTQRVSLTSSRDMDPLSYKDLNGTAEGPEVDGWAVMDGGDRLQVLLYCHHDDWDRKEGFDICLTLVNLPTEGSMQLRHTSIDAEHSNAYAEWVRQGRPDYPNEGQRAAIEARSGLEYCEAPAILQVNGGSITHRFTLPTHGISLLEFVKV